MVKRVLTAIAILASVLGLASVSYLTVDTLLSRSSLKDHDQYVLGRLSDQDLFTPLEQRIAERERLIAKLKDPIEVKHQQRKLATLYEDLGKRSLNLGQLARAEQSFQKAHSLDPHNTAFLSQIANLYAMAAAKQTEHDQRLELWRSSTEHWQTAVSMELNPQKKKEYASSAASASYQLATEFRSSGDREKARLELLRAKAWAPDNSRIRTQIDQMLSALE
ncbi:MAG TPA: hypothetical protein VEX38_10940 [Fimbriimonadaceae bacterium]|nr:hypothetical protein [Fimbriimonadaceae bacterium]